MGDEAWLDDDERQAWLGMMATFTLLDAALDRQLLQDAGLSHVQYGILSHLSQQPGRSLHMTDLAVSTSSSASRLSHAATGLEAKGWLVRARCSVNRRMVHATLTAAGYDLVAATAPGHVREVRRLVFDQLNHDQVRSLTAITRAVLEALQADGYAIPQFG